MAKRILVTGGVGFLGTHLCETLLKAGHEVTALDNLYTGSRANVNALSAYAGFEFLRHDVCTPFDVEVDEIHHLACPASPPHYQRNPYKTLLTCLQGTQNALELARNLGAKVLIVSTSEVYGDAQVHPQSESYWGNVNINGPRSCYDEGKRVGETMAMIFREQYQVDTKIVRVFNTYGPRMNLDDGRVVSNFVVQALKGIPLTVYGDGKQTRSFCYVEDLIAGFIRFMESDEAGPINLGNPAEATMLELAEAIGAALDTSIELVHKPLPKDDPVRRRPDITKAQQTLGWTPKVQLAEGIKRTAAEFKARLQAQGEL